MGQTEEETREDIDEKLKAVGRTISLAPEPEKLWHRRQPQTLITHQSTAARLVTEDSTNGEYKATNQGNWIWDIHLKQANRSCRVRLWRKRLDQFTATACKLAKTKAETATELR